MPLPVTPSEFEEAKIEPEDNLAVRLWKNLVCYILLYRVLKYCLDSNGDFTPEFTNDLCSVDCTEEET